MQQSMTVPSFPALNTHQSVKKCPTGSFGHTNVTMTTFSHAWTINDFSFCLEGISELKSAIFPALASDQPEWRLTVRPSGVDSESNDYVSISLELVSSIKPVRRAKFKLSLLNAKREETDVLWFSPTVSFIEGNNWGFKNFIRRDTLIGKSHELLPEDKLTLCCQVLVFSDIKVSSGQRCAPRLKIPECQLSNDFYHLFKYGTFSDVVLRVKGVDFHVHTNILAARCPAFSSMCSRTAAETNCDHVKITDMDHNVLRELLCFIYTGGSPYLARVAKDLLIVAKKYDLPRLLLLCEQSIYSTLSVETAAETLIFADLHCASLLIACVIDFVNAHFADVVQTPVWKALVAERSHLVGDVCDAFADQWIAASVPPMGS